MTKNGPLVKRKVYNKSITGIHLFHYTLGKQKRQQQHGNILYGHIQRPPDAIINCKLNPQPVTYCMKQMQNILNEMGRSTRLTINISTTLIITAAFYQYLRLLPPNPHLALFLSITVYVLWHMSMSVSHFSVSPSVSVWLSVVSIVLNK